MLKQPHSRCLPSCAALLALWFALPASLAAELKLLSAGAVEPGLRAAVARYESQSGDKVTITFATAPVLRDAESVVYNRASTGQYVANLLAKLGIADAMAGKTTQVADGAAVVKHLMQGRGREFGFAPITEILLRKDQGLVFVGALPAEVQNRTTYQASVAAQPRDEAAATRLRRFLSSNEAIALFRSAGID